VALRPALTNCSISVEHSYDPQASSVVHRMRGRWCLGRPRAAGAVTVLTPPTARRRNPLAGEALADLWERVTGSRPVVKTWNGAASQTQDPQAKLPEGDLVLIGSDAVHPLVHQLIYEGAVDSLGIQYGSDEYRLLCVSHQGRRWLILAGGSGRSTLYAVYDFFAAKAGVEYFWTAT